MRDGCCWELNPAEAWGLLSSKASKESCSWGLQEHSCAAKGHTGSTASKPGPLSACTGASSATPSYKHHTSPLPLWPPWPLRSVLLTASGFPLNRLLYKALLGSEMCRLLRKRRYNGQLPMEEDGSPSQKPIERL